MLEATYHSSPSGIQWLTFLPHSNYTPLYFRSCQIVLHHSNNSKVSLFHLDQIMWISLLYGSYLIIAQWEQFLWICTCNTEEASSWLQGLPAGRLMGFSFYTHSIIPQPNLQMFLHVYSTFNNILSFLEILGFPPAYKSQTHKAHPGKPFSTMLWFARHILHLPNRSFMWLSRTLRQHFSSFWSINERFYCYSQVSFRPHSPGGIPD